MALRAMLGYPPVTLAPGQYLIHCQPYIADELESFSGQLTLGNVTLTRGEIHTEVFAQHLYEYGNGSEFILVAPDGLVEGCPVSHSMYAAMTAEPVSEKQYEELTALREDIFWEQEEVLDDSLLYVRTAAEAETASGTATFVFPLYYLALVLTMVAATILTIQQLAEARHYRKQFDLLGKLGMDRREMAKALRMQFTIYYTMPVIPPVLVGSTVLLHVANSVEPGTMTGVYHPLAIIGMTLALFFVIYGIYIVLAYTSMKRSVLPQAER